MALTGIKILTAIDTDGLENKIKGAVAADPELLLYGAPQFNAGTRQWVQTLVRGTGVADGGAGVVSAGDINDATATGIALLTALGAEEARGAIGAGTSDLMLGTTADTALAGDYAPTLADITDMSESGRTLANQPNYTAMRTLLDLAEFATADAEQAAALLALGALATQDTLTASQIEDASDLGAALLTVVNATTARNLLELGQLAALNEVTASQISDNTITDGEVSPTANIAATKIATAAGANGVTATNLQATIQALADRIAALEAAP